MSKPVADGGRADDADTMSMSRMMSEDMVPTIDEEDKAMSTLGSQSAFLSMINMGIFLSPCSFLSYTTGETQKSWLTRELQLRS